MMYSCAPAGRSSGSSKVVRNRKGRSLRVDIHFHYFNNVIGNPLETTVAASHLIFDGVMERHPKLKKAVL